MPDLPVDDTFEFHTTFTGNVAAGPNEDGDDSVKLRRGMYTSKYSPFNVMRGKSSDEAGYAEDTREEY